MTTSGSAIHQFHSGTAVGDAITDQMFALQRHLRALGYDSEIYAEHIDERLVHTVRPWSQIVVERTGLLLVHHSMGHTAFDNLVRLDVPMVTVFHSITPAHFFDDAGIRHHVRLGFRQLRELAARSLFGIADSNHNRHQMYDAGFSLVDVLPVRTDFSDQKAVRRERTERSSDWLFVGRVVPNKRQLELVEAFVAYRRSHGGARLHLVGDLSLSAYVEQIRQEISRLGVADAVTIHGKVSNRELLDRYRDAGLFVSMSQHEGFGVPLLEAMAAGLPVVARDEAAVAETMGGAGALLHGDDPFTVAALAHVLDIDESLRARMIDHQDQRLERIEHFDVLGFLARAARQANERRDVISVQVQGPFETSYSLAILNREMALALSEHPEFDVTIYATEGPGDYTPAVDDLETHPSAAAMHGRAAGVPFPDMAIRQMFPPRVHDSTAGMTFQYFGWEESRLPTEYVSDFNEHLDGIGTMSSYVSELLADSGVVVPTVVVGVGVHLPDPTATLNTEELADLRRTRFLHISSAFPRKGVDVLLRAYFEEFTNDDDVSLVLKTFPNPHNDAGALLAELRSEFSNPPDVRWIDRDLDRFQIDALYRLASSYVHSARGEGFGLPVAEAMLAGVPVISVASTGLADFVSERTAAVIGHRLAPADTHLSVPGSKWAEPDIGDLRRELASAANGDHLDERAARVTAARDLIATEYTWHRVGQRWRDFLLERRQARTGATVAAVTTFNSRCGIAEYSAHLYDAMGEWVDLEIHGDRDVTVIDPVIEEVITRSWPNHRRGPIDGLLDNLGRSGADIVHVQYNVGFFELGELARLIRLESPRRPVVVTLHRTSPLEVGGRVERMGDIAEDLRLADAIIVHQAADRRRLASLGIIDNVHLMPIGTDLPIDIDRNAARQRHDLSVHSFVLGTFGFLLPHKGMITLLSAMAELRTRCIDVRLVATCALHPDPSSGHHLAEVLAEIERLDLLDAVLLITEFLDLAESRSLLACADVLVLPYEQTNESASAALRSVLPLGRAVVTSDLPIFDDALSVVASIPAPVQVSALADALENLWLDPSERERMATAVRDFAVRTSWPGAAQWTRQLYIDVLAARRSSTA